MVDRWATISPHIVWDLERIRYGPINIGPRCSVEPDCAIFPCTLKEGVTVRPLSHPPINVEMREGTTWAGVPARIVTGALDSLRPRRGKMKFLSGF